MSGTVIDVSEQGAFAVPAWAGAVVAFADVNDSGQLDRFEEPSVNCQRANARWQCNLSLRRVVAHRIVTTVADPGAEPLGDQIVVRAEEYDSLGAVMTNTRVCLTDDPLACSERGADAFGPTSISSHAEALSGCQLDVLDKGNATIALDVESDAGVNHVDIPTPPRLDLDVHVEKRAASFVVDATSTLPITHALVWIGEAEAETVYWSTEDADADLRIEGTHLRAIVPFSLDETCTTCKVMLQVASTQEHAETGTYSEARHLLSRGD